MTVTKSMIEKLLNNLNDAENNRPNCSVEETIASIDAVCAPDFQAIHNKGPAHDREAERQAEKMLFTMIPDYHRTIERMIVDPPYAAFEWIMTGTVNGKSIEIQGCSISECSEDGLLKTGRTYFDTTQIPSQPA